MEGLKNIIYFISKVAFEVLGQRLKPENRKILKLWNLSQLVEEKEKAYMKYLQLRNMVKRTEYENKCAIVKREIQKLHNLIWDEYRPISNIENNVHGNQF